jgi:small-conductance mechanosensitive channel
MKVLSNPDFWIALTALVGGLLLALVTRAVTLHYAREKGSKLAASIARHTLRPLLLLLPIAFGRFVQPLLDLESGVAPTVYHAGTLVLIFAFGWLLVSLVAVLDERLRERLLADVRNVRDNIRARRILTRVAILDRTLIILIITVSAGAMLLTFPAGRAIGASILASAGIAGLVLGIAARPAVETLIAGMQIALTEPIHIDDVVIVQGEWGRIEEIKATYVVLRIWDQRRLIIPLNYFIREPFQNWTRSGADLLAQVTVDVDYTTPIARVREEAGKIVTSCKLWNGKFWNLQVTEAGERTMRLRVLATAADSESAWDMRCEIREKLITYLQESHPKALPRLRAVLESESAARA